MKIKKTIVIVFAAIVSWAPWAMAWTDYSERLTFDGIRQARKAGMINREDYIVSSLASCFKERTVVSGTKSASMTGPGRNLTLLFKMAVEYYDTFSDDGKAYVDKLMMRPDETDNVWELWEPYVPFYLPGTIYTRTPDAETYPNLGGRYTFHYVLNPLADANGTRHNVSSIAFVDALIGVFETVYSTEVSGLGYPAPPSDENAYYGDNGGDGNIDVYIANCGEYGAYGYTVPLQIGPGSSMASYMVVDNDFTDFATPASEAMKVTVAHEFHHSIQFGINAYAQDWIMEASSTWIENEVYPDSYDNIQYLNGDSGFFRNTDVSIDTEYQWYNNWIFLEYMSLKWNDPGVVRQIWTYLASKNTGISAVAYAMGQEGSNLKAGFTDFAMKNYSQANFYADADLYDEVVIQNGSGQILDYSNDSSYLIDLQGIPVDHLATVYYMFKPGPGIGVFDDDVLMIQVFGESGVALNAGLSVKLIDGTYKQYDLDMGSTGYVYVPAFNDETVSEAVLALVNYSGNTADNGAEFRVEGGLGQTAVSSDGGGGSCFVQSLF